ncbi:MAG: hypothetical protein HC769_32285 [Cyanobacteria bacterium CRU_2_1]|nr:hypothetical protein [Cyanobacteria bacterium CRU_2_1]
MDGTSPVGGDRTPTDALQATARNTSTFERSPPIVSGTFHAHQWCQSTQLVTHTNRILERIATVDRTYEHSLDLGAIALPQTRLKPPPLQLLTN